MCGEKSSPFLLRWRWIGSPPRVRGKELVKTVCNIWDRITPACAGKSPHAHPQITQNKDHPRVCGEKIFSRLLVSIFKGSPPRVRGKELVKTVCNIWDRITPACAGKRLKKAHKIKDFDPVPIRFHLVFRRFERWCSNLPTPDGNVPV